MLGNVDVMDVLFSIISYIVRIIEQQQVCSVVDLLQVNDLLVWVVGGCGDLVDSYMICGFSVQNVDVVFNGFYGLLLFWWVLIEFVECVEVFKGLNVLFGGIFFGGSVGGIINLVFKCVDDQLLICVSVDWIQCGQFGIYFDIGWCFGENNVFGVCFNGVYCNGDIVVDYQSCEFFMFFLGLDFCGECLCLFSDLLYQKESLEGVVCLLLIGLGIIYIFYVLDLKICFGLCDFYLDQEDYFMVNCGEYDFVDNLMVFVSIGGCQSNYEIIVVNSIFVGNQGDIVNSLVCQCGDCCIYFVEVGLCGNFDIGLFCYDWMFSVNCLYEWLGMVYVFIGMQLVNFYQILLYMLLLDFFSFDGSILKINEIDFGGVVLVDRLLFFDDCVQVILGVCCQQIELCNYDQISGVCISYDKWYVWMLMVSVLVKLLQDLLLYVNYIQGFSQGEVVLMIVVNVGQVLVLYKVE